MPKARRNIRKHPASLPRPTTAKVYRAFFLVMLVLCHGIPSQIS
jgi:hypothetical protein